MEGKIVTSVTTHGSSPWFSGHFPDNPILPGIAQLKMVADLIVESGRGDLSMSGLGRIKFRKIVRPGDLLDIEIICGDKKDQYTFKITCGNDNVCSGLMFFTETQLKHNTTTRKRHK